MKLQEYFLTEGAKTPYALSKYLKILPSNVYEWLRHNRNIPFAHCAKIERFTDGKVTCEELNPSYDWDELWNTLSNREERRKNA